MKFYDVLWRLPSVGQAHMFSRAQHAYAAGLNPHRPALVDLFWDSCQDYAEHYKLWGVDFLHHVQLGIARRLGVDQLQVCGPRGRFSLVRPAPAGHLQCIPAKLLFSDAADGTGCFSGTFSALHPAPSSLRTHQCHSMQLIAGSIDGSRCRHTHNHC